METHDSLFFGKNTAEKELECENLYNMISFSLTILAFLVESILTSAVAIRVFHIHDRNYFCIGKLLMFDKRLTNEKGIPKFKQGAVKRKRFIRQKAKVAGLLCCIHLII